MILFCHLTKLKGMPMGYRGKTVLITGAAGGIGYETSLAFASRGASIMVNYHSSDERAKRLVEYIGEMGSEAAHYRADVSEPSEVEAMFEFLIDRFGSLDVLVNNAAQHPPPVFNFDDPDWSWWMRMVEVNIKGMIICSHYAAPLLKRSSGNIVNIVMDWDAGGIGYTLTKTAGSPLTRGLARELAPVRVNAVSPGAVDTWGMTPEERRYWEERTLLKCVGRPDDVANAIVFLASDDASYITGSTLHVDGGTRLLV